MKKFVLILLALSLCLASCAKIEQLLGIEKDVIGQDEQPEDSLGEDGDEPEDPEGPVETVLLGELGRTANCYVVSQAGTYSIPTVKGNSLEPVGEVASAEVLWESFGTDETPTIGDVIEQARYEMAAGKIIFSTPATLRNGNAVIAAKDASGEILWSWHLWVCKDYDPEATAQEYYNNAGTMMDRNLGATSATPGDVCALGLLYQWGRKDPFLGGNSISYSSSGNQTQASSTLGSWPDPVSSDNSNGTIEYAVKNPTTFIKGVDETNFDWLSASRDNTLWQSCKTIYDPCPSGWRVPQGGNNGVWAIAAEVTSFEEFPYDEAHQGMNFANKFGSANSVWYPAAGCLNYVRGNLCTVGKQGLCWSYMLNDDHAYLLSLGNDSQFHPLIRSSRALGASVRCQKDEGTMIPPEPEIPVDTVDLSAPESANCYLIKQAGSYKFRATVRGNGVTTSCGLGSDLSSVESLQVYYSDGEQFVEGDFTYRDGYIYFKTVSGTLPIGTVLLSALDASGNTIWSWHIWSNPLVADVTLSNGSTWLNMNVGAHQVEFNPLGFNGYYYQWGRKDPIQQAKGESNILDFPFVSHANQTDGSLSNAILNPHIFYGGYYSADRILIADWCTFDDNVKYYDWWNKNITGDEQFSIAPSKTMFDPCPPGYYVPDYEEFRAIARLPKAAGETLGALIEGKLFFPCTSWRAAGISSNLWNNGDSSRGYLWTSNPMETGDKSTRKVHRYYVIPTGANGVVNTYSLRATALPVRCLKLGTGVNQGIIPLETVDLSASGSGNSYVVPKAGSYSFPTVKGNSSESVGEVASAEVLWESFGTDETPTVGDIIEQARYEKATGKIIFSTPATLRNGNAVIAAKDASGTILWSWHIWVCKDYDPETTAQEYFNNAGTMMDRNLGATSATPGDVGALGLLYQWGRKDPFLGSSSISSNNQAASTLSWPSAVSSNSSNGTIDYAVQHPTTFISSDQNHDWYYIGSRFSTEDTRWQSAKTIYDPCPPGWKVPAGDSGGVWSKATSTSGDFSYFWNSTNKGIDFSGKFGSASSIWYPAAGNLDYDDGSPSSVGNYGYWWSCTPYDNEAFSLWLTYNGYFRPSDYEYRARGLSVRCIREGAGSGEPVVEEPELDFSSAINLSSSASANSYVVSASGTYSFPAVKGNSTESVGDVASAEVLWESFGTNVAPEKGDLISAVAVKDGKIGFRTPSTLKNGNAVIAAKDASGEILWSWHIWVCKDYDPASTAQEYYNDAGVMMDRNLGATSATPGDVGALGLMYQWGRKDPFLGSSSISYSSRAASMLAWPLAVSSNSETGTIEYAVAHPTTFITYNSSNYDWCYTGNNSTDDTRWQSSKTIYDPCPPGWKIPIGGSVAPWSEDGDGTTLPTPVSWDAVNRGINFSGKFGSASSIWYPAAGNLDYDDGSPSSVGYYGDWWSCTPSGIHAYTLHIISNNGFRSQFTMMRAYGLSVRCQKEGVGYYPETPVSSIKLNKSKTYLIPTMSAVLTATVLPNNATCATLSWTSSDPSVATVSDLGEIRAIAPGTATITAMATDRSKVSASVVVTVCPEVVDMGLSVKWRSCNLGASSVEDNGDLIAWGETEPKSEYNYDNYKWYDSSLTGSKITKYNDDDQRTVLEPEDDAAHKRLGGGWRMPTKEEFEELISICETEWISVNGTYMLKITNPNNGSWIFLPGGLNYSSTKSASVSIPTKDGVKGGMPMMRDVVGPGGRLDALCLYWSSSRQLELEIDKANYLLQYKWYNPMGGGSLRIRQYYRYDGLRIRPVMD